MVVMTHVGLFEGRALSALSPIIVRFGDKQVLDFDTIEDARGFLEFYTRGTRTRPKSICFAAMSGWKTRLAARPLRWSTNSIIVLDQALGQRNESSRRATADGSRLCSDSFPV